MSIQTIETMVTWLESNLTENPCLADMSKFVGYSPYYCSSKFHETLGVPFKTYLKRRKLCLAAQDLKETKERIIDIAFKYGFTSHEAFTRSFVHEYGYSPRQYRKEEPILNLFQRPIINQTE